MARFPKNISAFVADDLSLRSFADVFFLFPFEKPQNKLKPWSVSIVNTKRLDGWRGSASGGRGARGHGGG